MTPHRIPILRQRHNYDCGPTCVEACVSYCGWTLDADRLLVATRAHPEHGTDPEDLVPILAAAGLRPWVDEPMERDELIDHVESRGPVICPIRAYRDGHWVVVCDTTDRGVIVMDPASDVLAYRYLSWAQWMRRWWDTDRDETMRERLGICLTAVARSPKIVRGVPL